MDIAIFKTRPITNFSRPSGFLLEQEVPLKVLRFEGAVDGFAVFVEDGVGADPAALLLFVSQIEIDQDESRQDDVDGGHFLLDAHAQQAHPDQQLYHQSGRGLSDLTTLI